MRSLIFVFLLTLFTLTAWAQSDEREKGIELYHSGSHAEAVSVLQKVVEGDLTDKTAWTYLGGSLIHLGKKDEALKAFRKPDGGPKYEPVYEKEFRITKRPRVAYTEEARVNRINGKVLLMVEFKADGKVGFVVPFKSLPFGLTESAIDSAKRTTFSPPVKDGKPVPVIRMLSSEFSIY